jgi:hypothetical protein
MFRKKPHKGDNSTNRTPSVEQAPWQPPPASTDIPFADLIAAGNFGSVSRAFTDDSFQWVNKGNCIRGEFVFLITGRSYHERDLDAEVERESRRLNRELRLATAYELLYFASHGWRDVGGVVAFGSTCTGPDVHADQEGGGRGVNIFSDPGLHMRILTVDGIGGRVRLWSATEPVLCVGGPSLASAS